MLVILGLAFIGTIWEGLRAGPEEPVALAQPSVNRHCQECWPASKLEAVLLPSSWLAHCASDDLLNVSRVLGRYRLRFRSACDCLW